MVRSIAAVLAGYLTVGVLIVLTDIVVGGLNPGSYTKGQIPPVYYFVVSIIMAPFYSVAGGLVCARLSRLKPWRDAIALAVFGEIMGLFATIVNWSRAPHWYSIGLMVLYPPGVLAGAWLYMRKKRPAPARDAAAL